MVRCTRIIEYELRPLVEQYFFGKADVQVLTQIETHFKNILECSKENHSEATGNVHGYTL
jgi:hypothetical protein